jgi:hypothetical protein
MDEKIEEKEVKPRGFNGGAKCRHGADEIKAALEECGNNHSNTAKKLKIAKRTLEGYLNKYPELKRYKYNISGDETIISTITHFINQNIRLQDTKYYIYADFMSKRKYLKIYENLKEELENEKN